MLRLSLCKVHIAATLAVLIAPTFIGVPTAYAQASVALSCQDIFTPTDPHFRVKVASARETDEVIRFVHLQRSRLGIDPERGADGRSTTLDIESFETSYGAGHGRFFIVSDDLGTVGTVGYSRVGPRTCEIKRIYLDKRAQGQGQGRRLVEMAIRMAKQDGFANMVLQTRPEMSDALHLYQKLGFQKDAARSTDSVYIYSLHL